MAQATDSLGRLMESLVAVVRTVNRGLDKAGIDKAALVVLYALRHTSPARPSAVASWCGLDGSTISRHLKRLEEEGLIERETDPQDGRAQLTRLSERGEALVRDHEEARRRRLAAALAGWSEADRDGLGRLLARLADDLALDPTLDPTLDLPADADPRPADPTPVAGSPDRDPARAG